MNHSDQAKQGHPWYQFSLRTLLVFVLVAGMVLGLLGRWLNEPPQASSVLHELVSFSPDLNFDANGEVQALWNIRQSRRFCDNSLIYIDRLKKLQRLDLSRTQVTDAGLQHLHGLTNLKELTLRGTHVTDEGVKKLQRILPNCKIEY